jgi:hypothetical protein
MIKPGADIRLAKFFGRHSGDDSSIKSGSPQGRIVNDHRNAIACQTDVQLDSRCAVCQRSLESGQSILGCER